MKKTTQKTRKQLRDELKKERDTIEDLRTLNQHLRGDLLGEQAKNKEIKDSLLVSVNKVDRDIAVAVRVSGDMLRLVDGSTEVVVSRVYALLKGNIREAFLESGIGIGGNL